MDTIIVDRNRRYITAQVEISEGSVIFNDEERPRFSFSWGIATPELLEEAAELNRLEQRLHEMRGEFRRKLRSTWHKETF